MANSRDNSFFSPYNKCRMGLFGSYTKAAVVGTGSMALVAAGAYVFRQPAELPLTLMSGLLAGEGIGRAKEYIQQGRDEFDKCVKYIPSKQSKPSESSKEFVHEENIFRSTPF
jgi:hypothetical protein